MRTAIYIDGYNFYYSRLKSTPYKWLDIVTLFRDVILAQQCPQANVSAIKFFTAPVKASYARHGVTSEHSQTQYHRALLSRYEGLLQVIQGFHVFEPSHLPSYVEGQRPSKTDCQKVWLIEEKQTDVNIALYLYRDAIRGEFDQLVICSNDSDMEPALSWIKKDAPQVALGLVMPLAPPKNPETCGVPNKRLTALADWVRHYVMDEELSRSQLQQQVQTRKNQL
ncbi:MAG: NYN domain-containing protein [Limnohabitans sp.]